MQIIHVTRGNDVLNSTRAASTSTWCKSIEKVTCRLVHTGCHGFVVFNASSMVYSLRGKSMGGSFSA